MKKLFLGSLLFALLFTSANLVSCKSKVKESTTTTTTVDTTVPTTPTPPEISSDEALKKGVADATKDYPGVTATVSNGEVTLTGSIERDRLPKLLSAINSYNPKKVNNQLTIK